MIKIDGKQWILNQQYRPWMNVSMGYRFTLAVATLKHQEVDLSRKYQICPIY